MWFDNKCALVSSTVTAVETAATLEKFYLLEKKKVQVQFPDMMA